MLAVPQLLSFGSRLWCRCVAYWAMDHAWPYMPCPPWSIDHRTWATATDFLVDNFPCMGGSRLKAVSLALRRLQPDEFLVLSAHPDSISEVTRPRDGARGWDASTNIHSLLRTRWHGTPASRLPLILNHGLAGPPETRGLKYEVTHVARKLNMGCGYP